jgi:hypothetical protein
MVSGGARGLMIAAVVIGAAIVGAMLGAGIDFFTGNQGWWGVGLLGGLMTGVVVDARILEGVGPPRTR